MGGRGASSEGITRIKSYEDLIEMRKKADYRINMQKSVDIGQRGYETKTYTYNNAKKFLNNVNNAVVEVPNGDLSKRTKMLKESGFDIKYQSKVEKNAPVYKSVLLYIERM